MRLTLEKTEDIALNIKSFYFSTQDKPDYQAGQFTELFLPHDKSDDRGQKRWFTLSSAPTEDLLAITTKYAGDKASSFKNTLFNLHRGTIINGAAPMGDFVLPKDESIPLVFVAGGIGVTPFRSIIKYLKDSNLKRRIQLLQGINSEAELAFRDLFGSLDFVEYIPVVKESSGSWKGETGMLDAARIEKLAKGLSNKLIYCSGPEPMIESLTKALEAAGVPKQKIVGDFFPGYTTQ